jgi:hypothetical protein
MTALKPRRRLVNFRLTQEEYDRLAAVCARKGVPSISDFARSAILRTVEIECTPEGACHSHIARLDQRVAQLEASLRGLTRAADSLGRAARQRSQSPAGFAKED